LVILSIDIANADYGVAVTPRVAATRGPTPLCQGLKTPQSDSTHP
jgi:hypothetical protein